MSLWKQWQEKGLAPTWRGALYRLPWHVGIICVSYLMVGAHIAGRASTATALVWMNGRYREAFIAISLLLYSVLMCSVSQTRH